YHLMDSSRTWDGKEIIEVEELINQSKSIAIQVVENHLLRKQNKDYFLLEMLAKFLENLSQNVHSGDTTDISLHKLEELYKSFRKTALPKTREEFEVRAKLFYLIFEMENYLNIKKN